MKGYDVVVCSKCGFVFADIIPKQVEFDRHYKEMSKYEYAERSQADARYDLRRFSSLVKELSPFLPGKSARILDIGCATGTLLSLFKKKGFKSVTGIDPSPVCGEVAHKEYKVRVFTGPISRTSAVLSGERPFDCIILSGVLEHIRDIGQTLNSIRELLAPGGLVAIDVPDATRFARCPDAPFQQFSTEHINFFSPLSLSNLLQKHGFRKRACRRHDRPQTFGTIMPSVTAIFKKSSDAVLALPKHDLEGERELEKYIRTSKAVENRIAKIIAQLVKSSEPVIVWGVGTHTLHLLGAGRLAKVNILAFVDSNPHCQGRKLAGLPIRPPSWLVTHPEPIMISSRVFQTSIENQIREGLGLQNKLIKLYSLK